MNTLCTRFLCVLIGLGFSLTFSTAQALDGNTKVVYCSTCETPIDFRNAAITSNVADQQNMTYVMVGDSNGMSAYVQVNGYWFLDPFTYTQYWTVNDATAEDQNGGPCPPICLPPKLRCPSWTLVCSGSLVVPARPKSWPLICRRITTVRSSVPRMNSTAQVSDTRWAKWVSIQRTSRVDRCSWSHTPTARKLSSKRLAWWVPTNGHGTVYMLGTPTAIPLTALGIRSPTTIHPVPGPALPLTRKPWMVTAAPLCCGTSTKTSSVRPALTSPLTECRTPHSSVMLPAKV